MIEIVGIIGGLALVIAFFETALGRWNGKSFWYEFFNLIGAILLMFYAVQKDAYTNIVLNILWGGMALYAIKHMVHRHKHRKGQKVNWSRIYHK